MKLRLRTSGPRIREILLASFLALEGAVLQAVDWPQYRGPNHDGQSTETIRTNWSQEPPRQIWKVPLEPAYSSFAVGGGRAYTQVRRAVSGQDKEFCIALNAETGEEIWATQLGNDDAVYDFGESVTDDGPRSTPTLDGNRVYVLTSYLKLFCLDAGNGQKIWSKDLVAEYGGQIITWQNAASPLIDGELIFMNCNGPNQRLLALWKNDGSEAWKGQDDPMTHATPVAATIAGVRQIVFFAQSGLVSVVPTNGVVLWRYPFSYSTSTAASPVVADDVVYCSAAYGQGSGAVRISGLAGQLTTNEVWRGRGSNMNHWATPVHYKGFLYGIFGQTVTTLRCIELATGTKQWPQDISDPQVSFGRGGVLLVNERILVLSESGALVLVEPNPTNFIELARFQALDGAHSSQPGIGVRCWNVPAISDGRIYARSTTEAVCLDVAVAVPPTNRPPLAPTNQSPTDGATNQPLTLTLQAGAFNDPDNDGHASSRWIIKRSPDNSTVFDSGSDTNNLTSIGVPTAVLSNATTYSWSVAYTDARGADGPASTPTSFTTQPLQNRPPLAPTNQSPTDGATNQLLTLTLQAGAFNDPDNDGHASSRWIIKRSSDNSTVFDSGNDTNNLTSIGVPTAALSNTTTYSWSVAYTDARGAEGPGSTPTSFTTQPIAPLAPLKLFSTLTSAAGPFQLLIGSADGASLDTSRAANIDVFASTDLKLGLSGWIKLNGPLTPTNGRLSLEDPQSPGTAQRFFRVEERP